MIARSVILILATIAILAIVGIFAVMVSQPETAKDEAHGQHPQASQDKSAPGSDENSQQQAEGKPGYKQYIKDSWIHFIEVTEKYDKAVVALATVGIFAFTLALFVATYLLYEAGERHSERQLRAYITILHGSIVYGQTAAPDGTVTPGVTITVELKNSGQTPAYRLVTWLAEPKILEKNAIPWGPNTLKASKDSILGAGVTTRLHWTMPITDADRVEINNGAKKIFVWGGADYLDAFKQKRTYTFRAANQHSSVIALGGYWALNAEGEQGD
jgi:flagellar basal body-associated protein FliL